MTDSDDVFLRPGDTVPPSPRPVAPPGFNRPTALAAAPKPATDVNPFASPRASDGFARPARERHPQDGGYASLRGRAWLVAGFLSLSSLLGVFDMWAGYQLQTGLAAIQTGAADSEYHRQRIDEIAAQSELVEAGSLLVYVLGVILFLVWMHRAHKNLPA